MLLKWSQFNFYYNSFDRSPTSFYPHLFINISIKIIPQIASLRLFFNFTKTSSMKKTLFSIFFLSMVVYCHAQITKPFHPSSVFNDSLTRIVIDFSTNFYQVQGDELAPQEGMEVYQSKVGLPGASHCVIYRFHSQLDTSASWQAIMYQGENYEDALKIYKNIYQQLTKSKMKWYDNRLAAFKGEMEEPDENLRFTNTWLQLNVPDFLYKDFYAEIEITNSYSGWEVHLNLHAKKNDKNKY